MASSDEAAELSDGLSDQVQVGSLMFVVLLAAGVGVIAKRWVVREEVKIGKLEISISVTQLYKLNPDITSQVFYSGLCDSINGDSRLVSVAT